MRPLWLLSVPAVIAAALLFGRSDAQPAQPDRSADEAAILKNAAAFVDAFGKADAKTLAAFWTADGDYLGVAGPRHAGRAEIEKAFVAFFEEHKGAKLRIDVTGLRFPTADTAIEDGVTAVIPPDGPPAGQTRYTIVHVRQNGAWRIESVRETPFVPPSNHQHLRGLDWLVGEWEDDVKDGEVAHISFEWTENENFLVSHFGTTLKTAVVAGGTQWIGWDPTAKTVRSWMFESHGGFGQGTWSKEEGRWVIRTTGVLADGKKTAATNVLVRTGPDGMTWEVKDRTVDGQKLPDLKPVPMKRGK